MRGRRTEALVRNEGEEGEEVSLSVVCMSFVTVTCNVVAWLL